MEDGSEAAPWLSQWHWTKALSVEQHRIFTQPAHIFPCIFSHLQTAYNGWFNVIPVEVAAVLCSIGMIARKSLDAFRTAASVFLSVSWWLVKVGVESPGLVTLVTFPITLTKQLAEATSGRGGCFALRLSEGPAPHSGEAVLCASVHLLSCHHRPLVNLFVR